MPERSWFSDVSLELSEDPGEGVSHEGNDSEGQHMSSRPSQMHRCSHQTGIPTEHPPAASVLCGKLRRKEKPSLEGNRSNHSVDEGLKQSDIRQ